MKESGLRGQDVLTLIRLYVGAREGVADLALQNRGLSEPFRRDFMKVAAVQLSEISLN